MTKRKRTKGQTLIYKTVHRQIKIEKLEPHKTKVLVNSDDRERERAFLLIILGLIQRLNMYSREQNDILYFNMLFKTNNTSRYSLTHVPSIGTNNYIYI